MAQAPFFPTLLASMVEWESRERGGYMSVVIAFRHNGKTRTANFSKQSAGMPWLNGFFTDPAKTQRYWDNKPPVPLAPAGYGLMVVDFDSRWIADAQGFQNPMELSSREGVQNMKLIADASRRQGVELLVHCETARGMLHHPTRLPAVVGGARQMAEAIERARKAAREDAVARGYTPLDTWEIVRQILPRGWSQCRFFGEETHDWVRFLEALQDKGFGLGDAEVALWAAHADEQGLDGGALRSFVAARSLQSALPAAPGGGTAPRL